ncbi:peroxiredoxin [uncultured Desulfosarcina sp.]|uniref:peroxiredoxin n=1 Tax=uncultured Desulfosarcina sp. TaxID=218289 RepID=UPI0029C9A662|nr:peroxiredoxin [uncultured Desulfosarcina sp.]
MNGNRRGLVLPIAVALIAVLAMYGSCLGRSTAMEGMLYDPGPLKPVDSELTVKVGDPAPPFTLPSLKGEPITLRQYLGRRNVILSFVPAAWTPVCSDQWPGYNIARDLFEQYDAIILGITVDNLPTLFAWTRQMGDLWFPVLSDFWPHGETARHYGVLRSDGTAERALFIVDKTGIIRFILVSDINRRPDLGAIVNALKAIHSAGSE